MNRRRQIAVVFFSAVIILVLGVIVFLTASASGQVVTVYAVKAPASAGTKFTNETVEPIQIKGRPGDFAYTSAQPDGSHQFALNMEAGDIVRDNDLVPVNAYVPEPITTDTTSYQPAAGDYVDVFVGVSTGASSGPSGGSGTTPSATGGLSFQGGVVLIAHAVVVNTAASGAITVNVPISTTGDWATIQSVTGVKFYVQKTYPGIRPANPNGADPSTIVAFLSQAASGSGS